MAFRHTTAALGALWLLAGPGAADADEVLTQVALYGQELTPDDKACGLDQNLDLAAVHHALAEKGIATVTSSDQVPRHLQVHVDAGSLRVVGGCAAVLDLKMTQVIDFRLPDSSKKILSWAVVCEKTDLLMGPTNNLGNLAQQRFQQMTDLCVAQVDRNAR